MTIFEKLIKYSDRFSFIKSVDVILSAANVDVSSVSMQNLSIINITSACNLQSKFCEVSNVIIEPRQKPTVRTNITGIVGVNGFMTDEYLEKYILHQDIDIRCALLNFLDILSNSILSLRYMFEKKHNIQCLSSDLQDSSIGKILLSLSGQDKFYITHKSNDNASTRNKIVNIQEQFYTAAQNFFWRYARSSEGLRCILSGFFKVPVYIEQLVGDFIEIDNNQQSKIGVENKMYNTLGVDAYLGNKVWDMSRGFNVLVGPLSYQDYVNFLPKSFEYDQKESKLEKMKQIIREYVPIDYKVKIYIFLDKVFVGQATLNRTFKLHHNTFIQGKKNDYNTFFMEEI